MSQDMPFIRKSNLSGPVSWVLAESVGISKMVQTVLTRLMESHIWNELVGSVAL